jgi:flavin reductase (DIM6/NTAB) family NADH-FMN oxidoreductase RutF
MAFERLALEKLQDNPFTLINRDWMLITAGTEESFNTMTASWGGLGVLWEKRVAFCFVRPTRHTYQFLEREERFTLSFFDERFRKALSFCGSRSGRDTDKVKGAGLTPRLFDGRVSFEEARLVLLCRKLYTQDLQPQRFLDPAIEGFYPQKDYHRMYVGEIEECLISGKE